jgi:transposase
LSAVEALRQIWMQHDLPHEGSGVTRRDHQNIPPAAQFISSPYDVDARYARKHSTRLVGYTGHLTETCDDETPPLITHVLTTTAPVDDSQTSASIHTALETKGLLPQRHLVDTGYVDAERLTASRRDDAVDLCGAGRGSVRWQALTGGAFDLGHFVIDWSRQQVTCPAGRTSLSWTPAVDSRDNDVIKVKFAPGDCRQCRYRAQCTRAARRTLTVRPQEQQEALMANRQRQSTPAFKAEQADAAGSRAHSRTASVPVECAVRGIAASRKRTCSSVPVQP